VSPFPKDGSGLRAGNQFSFGFPGQYTSYQAIKLYLPPGTTEFSVKGFLPQQTEYAVVSRIGKPPERLDAVTSGEYAMINESSTKSTLGARQLGGEEMIHVHDGGGNTSYGNANLFRWPLIQGKWLYMRVLTGLEIYGLQGGGFVDVDFFSSRIQNTAFNATGQLPAEDCTLPVKPTGIELLQAKVRPGGTTFLLPQPRDAITIGDCAADPASAAAPYIDIKNYKITVGAQAPTGTVEIGCGDATDTSSGVAMMTWPSVVTPKFKTTLTIDPGAPSSTSVDDPFNVTASGTGTNSGTGATTGGTTTPTTRPALTGIALSKSQINVSDADRTFTVTPVPSSALLPSCVSDNPVVAFNALVSNLTIGSKETWYLSFDADSLSAITTVKMTCGAQSSSLKIYPANVTPDSGVGSVTQEVLNASGNAATLKVSVKRAAQDVGQPTDWWVAAMIPAGSFLFTTDQWFFLSGNVWSVKNPAAIADVLASAYQKSVVAKATDVLEIPLGNVKSLAAAKVKIFMGYRVGNSDFKVLDQVWDATTAQ
jgi:hypothetical protein